MADGRRWFLRLEWEPRDCWVGVYWNCKHPFSLDVWVCAIPMLPVHFGWMEATPFHPQSDNDRGVTP